MLFEWDEAKSRRNLNERGFGFECAVLVPHWSWIIVVTMARSESRRSVE